MQHWCHICWWTQLWYLYHQFTSNCILHYSTCTIRRIGIRRSRYVELYAQTPTRFRENGEIIHFVQCVVFREYERYEDIKRLAYLLNIMNTVFERYEDIKRVPTSGVLARLLPRKAPLLEWRQLALFKPKRLSQTLLKIRNAWRGNYWEKFVVVLSSGESSLKSLGGVSRWPGYISYLQSYQTWYSSLPDTSVVRSLRVVGNP